MIYWAGDKLGLSTDRVKGVVLLSPARHAAFASVPSAAELGQPDLLFESGIPLFRGPGAPQIVVDRLHDARQRAQFDEKVRVRLEQIGVDPERASRVWAEQQLKRRIELNEWVRTEAFGKSR